MKRLKFAATVTFRSLKRAFTTRPGTPLKTRVQLIINSLILLIKGYVHIDNMPVHVQAQALDICFRESIPYKYLCFRWQNLNYMPMLESGEIHTGYGYYINEDELD